MKQYFTFPKNAIFRRNYGIDLIYFLMNVFIFHSFYHRFFNAYSNNLIFANHILLLFKIYLYNSRKHKKVTLRKLIRIITKVKDVEREKGLETMIKRLGCRRIKWQNIENMLKKKTMLVSIMIQMGGGGILCLVFLLILNMIYIFSLFPLYLFVFVFHFHFVFIILI